MLTRDRLMIAAVIGGMTTVGCQLIAGLAGPYGLGAGGEGGTTNRTSASTSSTTTTSTTTTTTITTSTTTTSTTTTGTGPPTCWSQQYADPPGGTDSPDGGTYIFAVYSVYLGDVSGQPAPGYDLDNQDTCCNDAGPTCVSRFCNVTVPATWTTRQRQISSCSPLNSLSSASLSAKAQGGSWTLLIKVDGYNGQQDDPAVTVSLYPSDGFITWTEAGRRGTAPTHG